MTTPDHPGSPHRWPVMAALVLVAAVAAVHGVGVNAPFHYDDKLEILINPAMQGLGHWRGLFDYNPFRFLLLCTLALQYNTTGIDTVPFHLVNLFIHALNAWLVYGIARRIIARAGPWKGGAPLEAWALAAALLFAVHPLLVEGVTYISGRSSSLATTAYLAAFLVLDGLLRELETHPGQRARWQAQSQRIGLAMAGLVASGLLGSVVFLWMERGRGMDMGTAQAGGSAVILLGTLAVGIAYWRWGRQPLPAGPSTRRLMIRWLALLLLFALGVMTKEIAATLPAGLWLWELCMGHRGRIRPALHSLRGLYLPLIAGPVGMLLFRVAYFGSLSGPDSIIRPPLVNLWTQAVVVWRYVGLWLWPADLTIFHHHPVSESPLAWPAWLALAGWIGVVALAVKIRHRRPALTLVLVWPLLALTPTSSLIPLKETMADHRAYLPAAMWCITPLLLASLVPALRRRRWLIPVLVALAAVPLGVRTVQYTRLWQSEQGLWEYAAQVQPEAAEIWYMLGDIDRSRLLLRDAEQSYRRCLELDPGYHAAANNIGLVYEEQGRPDKALEWYRKAQDIATEQGTCSSAATNNIGNALTQREAYLDARDAFTDSLVCDPNDYVAHVGMGTLYDQHFHNRDRAFHHYQRAVQIRPDHPGNAELVRRIEELH